MPEPIPPGEAVKRVRLVPDTYRDFTEPVERAVRYWGVGQTLLDELTDLGLPCRGSGADRRFDRLDMENLGIMLWLRCPRRAAMRWWSRTFSDAEEATYDVDVSGTCSRPAEHGPACSMPPASWLAANRNVTALRPTLTGAKVTVRLPGGRVWFGAPYTDLFARLDDVQFHLLPPGLYTDLGFLAETRLANCSLAAHYLSVTGAELGLAVRVAWGILLATPFSIDHVWISVLVDGRWIAADPLLLRACARWDIVDPDRWPVHRSPQVAVWETEGPADGMLAHPDTDVVPVLRTSLLAPDAQAAPDSTVMSNA